MAFVLDASVALGWVVARQASAYSRRMRLARKFDLSAYDASYLALALELRMPIACSDGVLKSVLTKAGVKLA